MTCVTCNYSSENYERADPLAYEPDEELAPEIVETISGWINRSDPETSRWLPAWVEIRHHVRMDFVERAEPHPQHE